MKAFEKKFNELSPIYQVIALMVVSIFAFGLFGPSMISSKSTFAVLIGIAVCVAVAVEVFRLSKPLMKKIIEE